MQVIKGVYLDDQYLRLTSSWTPLIDDYICRNKITNLAILTANGWEGEDLSFLSNYPWLKRLHIAIHEKVDATSLNLLNELEYLHFDAQTKSKIDFSNISKLIELNLIWSTSFGKIDNLKDVKCLTIWKYNAKDLHDLNSITDLKKLTLRGPSKLISLEGLPFAELSFIEITDARKLVDISEIEKCKSLKDLELLCCKNITNLESITEPCELRRLALDSMGVIPSLSFLSRMKSLRELTFLGNTLIGDGSLSVLETLNLKYALFKNRRCYSHRMEDFDFNVRYQAEAIAKDAEAIAKSEYE